MCDRRVGDTRAVGETESAIRAQVQIACFKESAKGNGKQLPREVTACMVVAPPSPCRGFDRQLLPPRFCMGGRCFSFHHMIHPPFTNHNIRSSSWSNKGSDDRSRLLLPPPPLPPPQPLLLPDRLKRKKIYRLNSDVPPDP